MRIHGEITTSAGAPTGAGWRYAFPEVPSTLLDEPTLGWLLDSDRLEHGLMRTSDAPLASPELPRALRASSRG